MTMILIIYWKRCIHITQRGKIRKDWLVLPTFDLYGKLTGDGNDDNPITTFAYEIRTTFKTCHVSKNYLSNLSMDSINDIKFISYG